MASQRFETTPESRRPKFYSDDPDSYVHPDTGGKGHGGFPARNKAFLLRVTTYEKNELFQFARMLKVTPSYLVRQALEECYPDIFVGTNHNIKPPAKRNKQRARQQKTIIKTSLADGTRKIMNEDEFHNS